MVTLDATAVQDENDLDQQDQQEPNANGSSQEEAQEPAADSAKQAGEEQPGADANGDGGDGAQSGLAGSAEPDAVPGDQAENELAPEAIVFFEEHKGELEGEIAELAVEQTRLKAALKANRENLAEKTAEYEKHVSRGPERHPLLDRVQLQPAEAATDESGDSDDSDSVEVDAGEDVMPPDAVSTIRVHLLKTIESEGVEFGVIGTVVQAYVDEAGNTFLTKWLDEDETECKCAWMEAEEFEVVDDGEPPTSELESSPASGRAADDGSWRSDAIGKVLAGTGKDSLSDKIIEILEGHDIRTMGDLADAPTVKDCELTQLKGITENRLQKINRATERYWAGRKAAGK